jgi:Fic family protein
MNIEEFRTSPAGVLVPITGTDSRRDEQYQHYAFVPHPLPYDLVLTTNTHNQVSKASMAIGRLQEALKKLPNPQVLLQPALRREAQSTSALEGTYAPLNDIFEGDFVDEANLKENVREILNYVRAANRALELLKIKPVCVTMLSELQAILVRGTRSARRDLGVIRTGQVIIGDETKSVQEARFIPPPPGDSLIESMSDWEKWINAESDLSPVIKAALGHYQFEALHPYTDGNGRLGRLVISLQFVEAKVLDLPILNLSDWFNLQKDKYKDELLKVSLTGDFDAWVSYFCEAIVGQSEREIRRIDALLQFKTELTKKLLEQKERGIIFQMAEGLIGSPVVTIQRLADEHSVSYPTASSVVRKFIKMGILREVTGRQYHKIYLCVNVLKTLESANSSEWT